MVLSCTRKYMFSLQKMVNEVGSVGVEAQIGWDYKQIIMVICDMGVNKIIYIGIFISYYCYNTLTSN